MRGRGGTGRPCPAPESGYGRRARTRRSKSIAGSGVGLKAWLCPVPGKGNGISGISRRAELRLRQGKRGGDRRIAAPFRMGWEKSAPAGRPREYRAGSDAAGYDRGGMCRLDAQHAAHQGRIHGGRFRSVGSGVVTGQTAFLPVLGHVDEIAHPCAHIGIGERG